VTGRDHLATTDDTFGVRRGERETLEGALDWYRTIVEHKVEGLSSEQATETMTPTGLSLLGVVKHLGCAERSWFREVFAGEEVESIDSAAEFAIGRDDTVESILGFYRDEAERARQIAAGSSLETLSARTTGIRERVSLRWILVHMLEETARHAGHMDLMRERIDGQTGD
jgi:uncharacterized damage-inducible protein DinB